MGGSHGIFSEQIAVVVHAARRMAEAEHPVLLTVSMDETDVQTNFSPGPANPFHGDGIRDKSYTQELQATELRSLAGTRVMEAWRTLPDRKTFHLLCAGFLMRFQTGNYRRRKIAGAENFFRRRNVSFGSKMFSAWPEL